MAQGFWRVLGSVEGLNFYKLYIGDYQRDTAHLSLVEHGAYMLMLQHYYATEKPLPTGKALYRMLRAESKIERDAIDWIVAQFWTNTPDGLINGRALEEMGKTEDDEANAEARREAERVRQKRARDRRSDLYEQLRQRGVTPPFNATTKQLVSLLSQHERRDGTHDVTRDVTYVDTANHSHSHNHKNLKDNHPTPLKPSRSPVGSRLPPDFPRDEDIAWAREKRPDLDVLQTRDIFRDYWTAKAGKDATKNDWPATWRNWVRTTKATQSPAKPQPAKSFAWLTDDRATEAKGREVGLSPRPGESWDEFRRRIQAEEKRREVA